ncbi:unnamed protein product, partial [Effrenium voratum]
MPWEDFGACAFQPKLLAALRGLGFVKPTAVQAQAWPVVVSGRDVVGVSATGSGKTLAFLVPAFHDLMRVRQGKASLRVLVLAPTRELSNQIHEEGQKLTAAIGAPALRSAALYGGVDIRAQRDTLRRGVHWCAGTPGRLLDLLTRRWLSLDDLAVLVLDEADRMLDQGFEQDLRQIMTQRPPEVQTLLFTATWAPSQKVQQLAAEFLADPVLIQTGTVGRAANRDITHRFYVCSSEREKMDQLIKQINEVNEVGERMIVFLNTKLACFDIHSQLMQRRYSCGVLQGDLDQASREAALFGFRRCKPGILIATDVAARGLDVEDVKVVFNYDMPSTCDSFVHRVGRTGRAGKTGVAVTLLHSGERQDRRVAQEVADHLEVAGQSVAELRAFGECLNRRDPETSSSFSGHTGYTHNTGLTHPQVELRGHQLARILASDKLIVEETLRRGFRFMNIERSKALDDRFRRPKWRIRRLVPMSELRAAARRHARGEGELKLLTEDAGVVHALVADLYNPAQYVATEMFELPNTSDNMWQIFDQATEMLMECDDVEFAEQVTSNEAFQQALKAQWESGDKNDEFYYQTFSKLPFVHFKNKPFLHHLCEDGQLVETLRMLLSRFSHQTAAEPWLRLVDVESREKQYGNTAFHICAYAGHFELLEELVQHARRYQVPIEHLKTTKGETILDVALSQKNYACYNLVAPFFEDCQLLPDGQDTAKTKQVLVVDAAEVEGQAPRASVSLPEQLSLGDLAGHLRRCLDQLSDEPDLIYLKKVHIRLEGSSQDEAEHFLRLAAGARSLTMYRCSTDSLDVCTYLLQACVQLYKDADPAWGRLFILPAVQGDLTEESKGRFTSTSRELLRCLQAKSREGGLQLHSFGRDGSAGFAFPRRYLTRPCLADVIQAVTHVNIFIRVRERIAAKIEVAEVERVRKRSRAGRSLSKEDLCQQYFFAVKWGQLDRFQYCREEVRLEQAEDCPGEGLRAGVDSDSFLEVVSESLDMWMYPMTATMPAALK